MQQEIVKWIHLIFNITDETWNTVQLLMAVDLNGSEQIL